MSQDKNIKSILDDIFDIPKDGSNIKNETMTDEGENAYTEFNANDNKVKFEDKAKEVFDVLNSDKPKNIEKAIIEEDKTQESKRVNELEKILSKSLEPKSDETSTKVDVQQKIVDNNSIRQENDVSKTEVSDIPKKNMADKEQITSVKSSFNSNIWLLNSPSPEFDDFYSMKSSMLTKLLPGGEINFDKLEKELMSAKVDISKLDLYNMALVGEKMKELQHWKDRISEIQIRINRQYYLWERFIELVRGHLARIQYDKPIQRQEGLHFIHMSDMEMYFSELKSIHKTLDGVSKNFDNIFENLSRHITINVYLKDGNNRKIDRNSDGKSVYNNDVIEADTQFKLSDKKNKNNLDWMND